MSLFQLPFNSAIISSHLGNQTFAIFFFNTMFNTRNMLGTADRVVEACFKLVWTVHWAFLNVQSRAKL